jgi:hypothetical protein
MRRNHMRTPMRPAITETTCNTFDNFMFLLRTSGYLNNLPNAAGRLRIDVDQSGRSECPRWGQKLKGSDGANVFRFAPEAASDLRVNEYTPLVSFDPEVRKRACRIIMRTSESGH